MPVFHQMGHDSTNLLKVPELGKYNGAILSPLNLSETKMSSLIEGAKERKLHLIFDPQLYYPRTQREKLRSWSYFPQDVDTADYSSVGWWANLCSKLTKVAHELNVNTVCSPVIIPRTYAPEYVELMSNVTSLLQEKASAHNMDVWQTLVVNMSDLADYKSTMTMASIITKKAPRGIYLVLQNNSYPRRELNDPEELKGAMSLINALEDSGNHVIVSHSSSDLILWKEAGAYGAATGKYFNLRRFTPSRWDEKEEGGGGQEAYWFEESLLAFLRASDVTRVERVGLISKASVDNPFFSEINACLQSGDPWLALSWKFYLYWFQNIEERLTNKSISPVEVLEKADQSWAVLETPGKKIYLEERQNDGSWIRQWLRAISEYKNPW